MKINACLVHFIRVFIFLSLNYNSIFYMDFYAKYIHQTSSDLSKKVTSIKVKDLNYTEKK